MQKQIQHPAILNIEKRGAKSVMAMNPAGRALQ